MKNTILIILFTLTLLLSANGQIEKYENSYSHPSKTTKHNAKIEAKEWLNNYASHIGIPLNLHLGKLKYKPSESTYQALENLFDTNKSPTDADIQVALHNAEKCDMYDFIIDFDNGLTDNEQTLYFEFNYSGQLLGITIYESDGVTCHSYTLDGIEFNPYKVKKQ